MIKKILLTIMLIITTQANTFKVNDDLSSLKFNDQFEKEHTISKDIKTVIVSFEKDTSKMINTYLASKDGKLLEDKKALFIADISGMPSIITALFAMPKMKKYKYNVLLIEDEDDKRFIHKEEKNTVYTLENGKIKTISYIATLEELAEVLK